jgi:hypothetical protein
MKVMVMLRACGLLLQAPRSTAAAATATSWDALRINARFTMAIACPADTFGGKGLRWLLHRNCGIEI